MRVRPLSARERELGGHKCVQQPDGRSVRVLTSEQPHFTFDTVAGEAADQASFFAGAGAPASPEALACMLASPVPAALTVTPPGMQLPHGPAECVVQA